MSVEALKAHGVPLTDISSLQALPHSPGIIRQILKWIAEYGAATIVPLIPQIIALAAAGNWPAILALIAGAVEKNPPGKLPTPAPVPPAA